LSQSPSTPSRLKSSRCPATCSSERLSTRISMASSALIRPLRCTYHRPFTKRISHAICTLATSSFRLSCICPCLMSLANATALPGCMKLLRWRDKVSFKLTRVTVCTAKRATSKIRPRILRGSRQKVAAPITPSCNVTKGKSLEVLFDETSCFD